jgi:flagella synthesis protein FlgN
MIEKTYPITQNLLINGRDLSLKLLDLLTQEEQELKQKTDATVLSAIVNNKKESVTELDLFSKQFSQVLATEKLQLSHEGIAEYFSLAKKASIDTSKAITLWQEIVKLSKQCQSLNQKNGASINILAQYTQRSLHILKGKSPQTTTYGSDGSTYNEPDRSHHLTSA